MNYHHLLLVNKYNGRGLMKTVAVERVVGEEKGHAAGVRISMVALLSYFDILCSFNCKPWRSTGTPT